METVSQTLDSTIASIEASEFAALELARRSGFKGPSLDRIGLAVHEIATNTVVHGNRYDPRKVQTAQLVGKCYAWVSPDLMKMRSGTNDQRRMNTLSARRTNGTGGAWYAVGRRVLSAIQIAPSRNADLGPIAVAIADAILAETTRPSDVSTHRKSIS